MDKLGPHELKDEHVFVDSGVSRAEFAKRPGLIALLRAVETKEVDVVVTRDETAPRRRHGSRLTPDPGHDRDAGALALLLLRAREKEVQSVNDAVSKFMVTARNFAAELEREKIWRNRTHEHLLVKARKGLNVGGRVYGYSNVEVMDSAASRKHVEYAINAEHAENSRHRRDFYTPVCER